MKSTYIHLNESKLMEYYEKMMDEIYLEYFTFPSDIPNIPMSDADRADMSYYNAMGRAYADLLPPGKKNKRVKFHSDPKYCNGLRRRR